MVPPSSVHPGEVRHDPVSPRPERAGGQLPQRRHLLPDQVDPAGDVPVLREPPRPSEGVEQVLHVPHELPVRVRRGVPLVKDGLYVGAGGGHGGGPAVGGRGGRGGRGGAVVAVRGQVQVDVGVKVLGSDTGEVLHWADGGDVGEHGPEGGEVVPAAGLRVGVDLHRPGGQADVEGGEAALHVGAVVVRVAPVGHATVVHAVVHGRVRGGA